MPRIMVLALVAVVFAAAARAHEAGTPSAYSLGPLTISAPFARAAARPGGAGAAYLTIRNDGATDRLVSAQAEVAALVELHTHVLDGDIMRMRMVEAIDVAGGTTTALSPGGLHVMLIGLKRPLVEGERFALTLVFERAGAITIDMPVAGPGATASGRHMH